MLAYDSVFLSFLAFPPVNQIKDTPDLARAIKNDRYHVAANIGSNYILVNINDTNLRNDLENNNSTSGVSFDDFIHFGKGKKLAFVTATNTFDIFGERYFISEDNLVEKLAAFLVRKGFCCKKMLDRLLNRMMAAGHIFKFESDSNFVLGTPLLMKYYEENDTKRKLTLTDLAATFFILISGYILSIAVLFAEVISSRSVLRGGELNIQNLQLR